MGSQAEQYWSDEKKALLIAQIVNGEISVREACRRYGLSQTHIKEWVEVYRYSARYALDDQLTQILKRQGIEATDPASAEFYGNLSDIDLTDLLQTIETGGKDGIITLRHDGTESKIWFIGGQVVDAHSGKLLGELALYRVLACSEGRVFARFRAIQRERSIHNTTRDLILEAARRKDECDALKQSLGNNPLCRTSRLNTMISQEEISRSEMDIIPLLDGLRSTQEVVAQSPFGDLETLQMISRLLNIGCLTPNRSIICFPKELNFMKQQQTKLPLSSLIPQTIAKKVKLSARSNINTVTVTLIIAVFGSVSWFAASRVIQQVRKSPTERQHQAGSGINGVTSGKNPFKQESSAEEFVVDIRTQPADARLTLDSIEVAEGHLSLTLPRDGRPHEIRIEAEGYIPQTLRFTDSSPLKEVILLKSNQQTGRNSDSEKSKKRSELSRPIEKRAEVVKQSLPITEAPLQPTSPLPPKSSAAKKVPKIQIIETEKPVIQLVE